MHILAFMLMFIFGAIGAAMNGDYSGISIIGKVLLGIGIFFFVGCILTGFSNDGAGSVLLFSIVMVILGAVLTAIE